MNDLSSSRPKNVGSLDAPLNPRMPLAMSTAHLDGNSPEGEKGTALRLKLCVTSQDHYWSERSGLRNPILCALQRETRTLWRIYEDGFALEAMPPYRACQLPPEAVEEWRRWLVTGEMEAPEWEIELVDTKEQDGYSLIQRRQTNLRDKCGCKPKVDGMG